MGWEGKALQRGAGEYLQTMPTFQSSWKIHPTSVGNDLHRQILLPSWSLASSWTPSRKKGISRQPPVGSAHNHPPRACRNSPQHRNPKLTVKAQTAQKGSAAPIWAGNAIREEGKIQAGIFVCLGYRTAQQFAWKRSAPLNYRWNICQGVVCINYYVQLGVWRIQETMRLENPLKCFLRIISNG